MLRRRHHLRGEFFDEVGQLRFGTRTEAVRAPGAYRAGFAALLHALLLAVAAFEQGLGVHLFSGEHVSHVGDLLAQGLRVDAVLLVVCDLNLAATHCLGDGLVHRVGDVVGIHVDLAGDVSRGAADRLDEGTRGTQETLLVGVENRNERDLGQVQALAQKVDADEDVKGAQAQLAQQLHAAQRVDVGVQVLDLDSPLGKVGGKFLGHLLGQGRHEDALVAFDTQAHLFEEVVDLSLRRLDDDKRVDEARGSDDLLDHPVGALKLVGTRRRGQVDGLADARGELVPLQRTVVHRGGQAETVVDERSFAGHVPFEHRADLRDGHVGLVNDEEEVLGEVVEKRVRGCSGTSPVNVARVVFDPRTRSNLLEHLQIEGGAHAQALFLDQLVLGAQPRQAFLELILNGGDGLLHAFLARHVVGCGEEVGVLNLGDDVTGERVEHGEGVDLVAEHFDANGEFLVDGNNLDRVTAHAEGAAREGHVVAHVLHGDEPAEQGVAVHGHATAQLDHSRHVLFGCSQTVDARDRGDDDRVSPGEQGVGGAVAQAFHLVVDGGVLLDKRVRLRHVRLGLVVVVVGHEVLDGIARQERTELGRELRGEGLVGFQDERRALQLLDEPRRGGALPRARRAHEDDVLFAVADARSQLADCLGLIARRRVGGNDLERLVLARHGVSAHAPTLPPWHGERPHKAVGFAASVERPGLVTR